MRISIGMPWPENKLLCPQLSTCTLTIRRYTIRDIIFYVTALCPSYVIPFYIRTLCKVNKVEYLNVKSPQSKSYFKLNSESLGWENGYLNCYWWSCKSGLKQNAHSTLLSLCIFSRQLLVPYFCCAIFAALFLLLAPRNLNFAAYM